VIGEMLSLGFMQRALLGGAAIGAACALLSVFVVLKRMAFVGQGVSHAAFGGVALAVLVGAPPTVGGLTFAVITALAIGGVARKRAVTEDAAIGIFLAVAMALGLVFLSLAPSGSPGFLGYLFGSILTLLPSDLLPILVLSGAVLVLLLGFGKELYFYVFDEDMARVAGLPVDRLYFGLLLAIAVTVVVGIQLMGVILITALLVIPGATARLLTRNFTVLMAIAVGLGVTSVVIGLTAAYRLDVSPAACIVLVLFAAFLGALAVSRRARG